MYTAICAFIQLLVLSQQGSNAGYFSTREKTQKFTNTKACNIDGLVAFAIDRAALITSLGRLTYVLRIHTTILLGKYQRTRWLGTAT